MNNNIYVLYSSIEILSRDGAVTVDNNILSEMRKILNGLGVRFSTIEFFGDSVTNIILS